MQLELRGVNYELDVELKDFIERRLHFALGRFGRRIHRLSLQLTDLNGPRGGIDKRCRITIALIPRGLVMVESQGGDPFALVADAVKRAGRALRRELDSRGRRTGAGAGADHGHARARGPRLDEDDFPAPAAGGLLAG